MQVLPVSEVILFAKLDNLISHQDILLIIILFKMYIYLGN